MPPESDSVAQAVSLRAMNESNRRWGTAWVASATQTQEIRT